MTITVEVTNADIDEADKLASTACMVHLALRRHFEPRWFDVGTDFIIDARRNLVAKLPPIATQKIRQFDAWCEAITGDLNYMISPPRPTAFSFAVDVPSDWIRMQLPADMKPPDRELAPV